MTAYFDAWLIEAPEATAGITRALDAIARPKPMPQTARDQHPEDVLFMGVCSQVKQNLSRAHLAPTATSATAQKLKDNRQS